MISIIFVLLFPLISKCFAVTVQTKLGLVEGQLSRSINGQPFSIFNGIPFAKAPVGNLRFRKPVAVEPWSGTLKADKKVECIQLDAMLSKKVLGKEDCLIVNIYVPGDGSRQRSDTELLPVMFWIHGGAFFFGSGSMDFFGPERFMDHDVILVTTNYRLGPLGFMSTSNDDLPANLGLWDQNLALRWVQNYIRDFGGDPKKVTIFGQSAGSMSVMYHYLSPQSKGLFQGAIAQSAPATSCFLKVDKNPIYYARSLAEKVGCNPKANTADLVTCLRKIDASIIQEHTVLFPKFELYPNIFQPYIDDFNSDPFVPKDPWELIESGVFNDVPLIHGNNNDEGLMSAYNFYHDPTLLEELQKGWADEFGPLFIALREWDEVDNEIIEVTKQVSEYAFPGTGKPTYDNILTGFKDIVSDTVFNAVGTITARKIANKAKSPVYEYLYKHQGTISFSELTHMEPWKIMLKYFGQMIGWNLFPAQHGVSHADELFVMFKPHMIPIDGVYTDEDKETSKNILKLWTDFAMTGNPTPDSASTQWTRLSNVSHSRLEIGSGTLKMNLDGKLENRLTFWSKVWSKNPTEQRLKTSKSWFDPMLYHPTKARREANVEGTKQEL